MQRLFWVVVLMVLMMFSPFVSITAIAQERLSYSLFTPNGNWSASYVNGSFNFILNRHQDQRFDTFYYNPVRFGDEQVISIYRPDMAQDQIYFVDNNGNTNYMTYGLSSPRNFSGANMDSFSPYGTKDIKEALVTGILATFFQGKIIKFRNH